MLHSLVYMTLRYEHEMCYDVTVLGDTSLVANNA